MQMHKRPLSVSSRVNNTLQRTAAFLLVGLLLVFGGSASAMAIPDEEPLPLAAPLPSDESLAAVGQLPAATTIFEERFEHGTGAQVVTLADYVGAEGTTYTASAPWLNYDDCNNLILRYESPTWQQSYCNNNDGVRRNVQRLSDVLGQVETGVVGSTNKNTPVDGSTPQTRMNHAASAYTHLIDMAPNLAVFESAVLPARLQAGHFYTTSIDVAELSCEYAGGQNNSKLDFTLVIDGVANPLQADPIRACTDPRVGYYTSPAIDGHDWGSGGGYVGAGTYYSDRSYLMPSGAAGEVRLLMTNQTGSSQGNDFAYDNVELVDVTPVLSKSFEPSSIEPGETTALTLTVMNTEDLAEKNGWSFTDTLPDGLVLEDPPNIRGTCAADVSGEAGASQIVVENGVLPEGTASCTIVVDITTANGVAPGVFENCATNIDPAVGVVGPAVCAEIVVRPAPAPALELAKDADRENLTAASVGDTITYSFTVKNAGNTVLENVTPEEVEFSGTGELSPFSPGPVTLEPGESQVFTASYVVTADDVSTPALINTAKATGNMPGAPPIESPPANKEIPVLQSGFDLQKSADPESGASVMPGQTISYTVTGENTGETVLDPVVITDDLSQVLNNARLAGEPTASIDGADVSDGLVFDQRLRQLTWTGKLEAGETVMISYSVTVNENAGGQLLNNSVSATAEPPGLPPITPQPPTTEHPVLTPSFELSKTSDPDNGSEVHPGDVITYTLTGYNSGDAELDPVAITDELGGMWDYAVLDTDSPTATIGSRDVSAGLVLDETAETLTWMGALSPGETVTVAFKVTVKENVEGVTLDNRATATAQPPGAGEPLRPAPPTTEHPVPVPGFELSKSSNPEDGADVNPGDTITYTVIGENTGETLLDPVQISDDLSEVLSYATLDGAPSATIGSNDVSDAVDIDMDAHQLSWEGALESGEKVTITYSVVVNSGVQGVVIENRASGSAQPPGTRDPLVPQPPKTEHPVPTPGFDLDKVADPADGESVLPGDTITYTLTGANTGGAVLNDVTIVDDLSAVLDNATLAEPPAAYIGDDLAVPQPIFDNDENLVTWQGELAVDQSVRIVYSVVVNENVAGEILENRATAQGTPPGGTPISPPPVDTEHFVPQPGFNIEKSASPSDGTAVRPGEEIVYTVTGVNTGGTELSDVVVADDLARVLNYATYGGDATATIGDEDVSSGLVYDDAAQTLVWTGTLQPGEQVEITYSVTVNDGVAGVKLENRAGGSAIPPGNPPVTPPDQEVEHPVPAPGFTMTKTSDPRNGSAVVPGDEITYTIIGTNTGETVLAPVTIEDDLSEILDNATLHDGYSATINGVDASDNLDINESAGTLTWTGALQTGEAVVIEYVIAVNDDAEGALLMNKVAGSATPPGPGPSNPPIIPNTPPVEHPVLTSAFELEKTSDPTDGAEVHPGDTITYTVQGRNTGETVLDPVVIADDLSQVLNNAELVGDIVARIGDVDHSAGLDFDERTKLLTWSGELQVGETVEIVYAVQVNADAQGQLLFNIANGTATPPGVVPPIEPSPPTVEHPVPTPGFSLEKSSNPPSGTAVFPGDEIAYTVVGSNVGETTLDPVVITDDLGSLWDYASLDESSISASIGARDVSSGLELDGDAEVLTWSGAVEAGEAVTIAYSVTVNENVQGVTLGNQVAAEAQPPGTVDPIVPVPPTTEHPVPTPGFDLRKSSDPGDGAVVVPGDSIAYALTGENTGETVLDPVVITDDLSQVLNSATLGGDPQAFIGDVDVSDGVVFDAESMQLVWMGVLEAGEIVTITYAVTVNDGVSDTLLLNRATGAGIPPGSGQLVPPPVETEHSVPAPGFDIGKTADPADGSIVRPGETITYTVTGTNTGGMVLDPVYITDDLGRVLDNAEYNQNARAVIGEQDVSNGLTYDSSSQTISWAGVLHPGESVELTYSVTVKTDASGGALENRVSGSATPPGHSPLTPPDKEVEHRIGVALSATGLHSNLVLGAISLSALLILAGAVTVGSMRKRRNA